MWSAEESDYYGIVLKIYELFYGENSVVVFKCHWFDNTRGVRVVHPHGLVEVRHQSTLAASDVFILASQAQQVYYINYPSNLRERRAWWVACKVRPRREFAMHVPQEEGQLTDEIDDVYQDDGTSPGGPRPDNGPDVPSHSLADSDSIMEVDINDLYNPMSRRNDDTEGSADSSASSEDE